MPALDPLFVYLLGRELVTAKRTTFRSRSAEPRGRNRMRHRLKQFRDGGTRGATNSDLGNLAGTSTSSIRCDSCSGAHSVHCCAPSSSTRRVSQMSSAQIALPSFMQLHAMHTRGGLDSLPGCIRFGFAHVLDLAEARHRVSDMAGVLQGLFALRRKRELR